MKNSKQLRVPVWQQHFEISLFTLKQQINTRKVRRETGTTWTLPQSLDNVEFGEFNQISSTVVGRWTIFLSCTPQKLAEALQKFFSGAGSDTFVCRSGKKSAPKQYLISSLLDITELQFIGCKLISVILWNQVFITISMQERNPISVCSANKSVAPFPFVSRARALELVQPDMLDIIGDCADFPSSLMYWYVMQIRLLICRLPVSMWKRKYTGEHP